MTRIEEIEARLRRLSQMINDDEDMDDIRYLLDRISALEEVREAAKCFFVENIIVAGDDGTILNIFPAKYMQDGLRKNLQEALQACEEKK